MLLIRSFFFALSLTLVTLISSAILSSTTMAEDSLDDLQLITESYPPFNFQHDGKIQGVGVDILLEMLKIAGSSKTRSDIQMLPWTKGYTALQRTKNTLLFSTTRTEARENLFKWVGPIMASSIGVIARKDRHIKISSTHDLNQYKIGAVRDDVAMLLMLEQGVAPGNIFDTSSGTGGENLGKMLAAGRIDLWGYGLTGAFINLRELGYPVTDFEAVYTLKSSQNYYALHKDTDDRIIAKLQAALDELRASGHLQDIIRKYVPGSD